MADDRKAVNRRPRRRARRFFRGALFGFLLLVVAALATLAGFYVGVGRSLPSLDLSDARGTAQTTRIYDDAESPTLLAELHGVENRQILSGDGIPQVMRDAVVAIEDERFYIHQGVDFLGILRAAWANVLNREIVQGGSTITQQYIKNAYITDDQTLDRKMREAALAYQLEKQWSKEKILNEYLNIIYFGEGAYGVEAAAQEYFGVSASDLSIAQAALLAGLPKAPSAYSPRKDAGKAMARRDLVLNRMYQQDYISSEELQEALDTPLALADEPEGDAGALPYWVEMVREQLVARYGSSTVLSGGLKVYVSVDLELQQAAEAAIASVLDQPGDPSAALVSIDVRSGKLLAMVGGADFSKLQFNLATQGRRQPGSAFKPFVLVTALEQGISPDALYDSGPFSAELPGGPWEVSSDDEGLLSLTDATASSSNGVYARLIMAVGADAVAETAQDMGIVTSLGDEPGPAIALGGLTTGVSPLEMAMAYVTLAGGGERLSSSVAFDPEETSFPVAIVRVLDASGRVLDENEVVRTRVLDPDVAAMATSCLRTVIERGTGTAADIGRPAAGKTGTTQNYRDAWFVGYTPDIVTAVWVGYPTEQKAMTDVHGGKVTGGGLPAKIWAIFMKEAVADIPPTDFPRASSDGWVTVQICTESGQPATEFCLETTTARFAPDKVPTEPCALHAGQEVPDVVGLPAAEAETVLKDAGFLVSMEEDARSSQPAGTVVAQDPAADGNAAKGATVTITVSSGASQKAEVPSLVGMTVEEARAALDEAGLFAEESEVPAAEFPAGTVIEQEIEAGALVDPGTVVGLVVSAGPPETSF